MTEPVLRPGVDRDIDRVAALLSQHMNRKVPAERFRRLMDYQWAGEKPHVGMVAEVGNEIVGFLGSVYSMRLIDGVARVFASFTSLYVHKAWRGYGLGLRMMQTYEARPDVTYTVYDPSERVHAMLEQCGFRDLDTHRLVWEQGMAGAQSGVEIIEDPALIAERVGDEHRRYLSDHARLPAVPVLFSRGDACVFCFFVRQDRGPDGICFELIYTSDPPALVRLMNGVAGWALGADPRARLLVDERFLGGRSGGGMRQPLSCRRMVRRATPVVPGWRVDHLYSETLLLDLKLGL